jgi:3-dehydroquinate synthase
LEFRRALQQISVPFDYPVYGTRAVFDPSNLALVEAISRREPARRHRLALVIDAGVRDAWPSLGVAARRYAEAHAARLELTAEPLVVAGGELCKNEPAHLANVQRWLHELGMDRQSSVVIVGGGAVLDMAGFAAATTHRGVRVVRIPTTVLAQGDSGVGVKNGVNAFGKKNFLGTFAPPFAVINDFDFLETLSHRDKIAGMAEAVKVALVRDRGFFAWIVENVGPLSRAEPLPLEEIIERCAELHLLHIRTSGDPFELGSARPLDFGHWAAHKLESLTDHRLRHGESVAIGMAIDSLYSARTGTCAASVAESVIDALRGLGFRLFDDALRHRSRGRLEVLSGLDEFREHLGGELTVTLLADVGRGIEVHEMQEEAILWAIDELERRA